MSFIWQSSDKCSPPHLDAFSDGWQRCCHFCHSRPGKWKSSGDHEADFQCDRQESSQHGEEEGTEFSPYLTCAVTLGSVCNLIHLRGFVFFFANVPLFFFETILSLYVSLQLYAGKTKKLQQKLWLTGKRLQFSSVRACSVALSFAPTLFFLS